jgi:NAD(P)-dependent dehydrogenase (short-subunit alcohol dehydrogenase family)
MADVRPRIALVVGGSSGFGAAIVDQLRRDGLMVIGTSRQVPADQPIDVETPALQCLDIRDEASVAALQAHLARHQMQPDVIVVNAGFGISGPVEDTPTTLAQAQFETNFFGSHRVVRAFLPAMRQRGSGQFIFIGSIAGQIALPFQPFYSASKAALAAYSDALRMEVMRHGIGVSLVEPGDHRTEFGAGRKPAPGAGDSAYQPQLARALALYEAGEQQGPPASELATLVARIARTPHPRPRYVKGLVLERLGMLARNRLPGWLFERLIMLVFRIPRS